MPIINTTCIVIVVIGFALVAAYMVVVHKFIKDAETNDGKSDSSHSHH
jgi:hypothetical protein